MSQVKEVWILFIQTFPNVDPNVCGVTFDEKQIPKIISNRYMNYLHEYSREDIKTLYQQEKYEEIAGILISDEYNESEYPQFFWELFEAE